MANLTLYKNLEKFNKKVTTKFNDHWGSLLSFLDGSDAQHLIDVNFEANMECVEPKTKYTREIPKRVHKHKQLRKDVLKTKSKSPVRKYVFTDQSKKSFNAYGNNQGDKIRYSHQVHRAPKLQDCWSISGLEPLKLMSPSMVPGTSTRPKSTYNQHTAITQID